MKKIIFILFLTIYATLSGFAQEDKYLIIRKSYEIDLDTTNRQQPNVITLIFRNSIEDSVTVAFKNKIIFAKILTRKNENPRLSHDSRTRLKLKNKCKGKILIIESIDRSHTFHIVVNENYRYIDISFFGNTWYVNYRNKKIAIE